jgi:hypothetical protein
MNKYLEYLLLFTVFVLVLKGSLPSLLDHGFVQLPAITVFGILVPIAFATSLHSYFIAPMLKKLFSSLSYLLIFIVIITSALVLFYSSNSSYYILATHNYRHAPELFNGPIEAEDLNSRKNAAKIIYSEYGGKVPYKLDSGVYMVYEPTTEDIAVLKENLSMRKQAKELKTHLKTYSYYSLYISIYLLLAFFILFSGTIYIKQRQVNQQLQRTP